MSSSSINSGESISDSSSIFLRIAHKMRLCCHLTGGLSCDPCHLTGVPLHGKAKNDQEPHDMRFIALVEVGGTVVGMTGTCPLSSMGLHWERMHGQF